MILSQSVLELSCSQTDRQLDTSSTNICDDDIVTITSTNRGVTDCMEVFYRLNLVISPLLYE